MRGGEGRTREKRGAFRIWRLGENGIEIRHGLGHFAWPDVCTCRELYRVVCLSENTTSFRRQSVRDVRLSLHRPEILVLLLFRSGSHVGPGRNTSINVLGCGLSSACAILPTVHLRPLPLLSLYGCRMVSAETPRTVLVDSTANRMETAGASHLDKVGFSSSHLVKDMVLHFNV